MSPLVVSLTIGILTPILEKLVIIHSLIRQIEVYENGNVLFSDASHFLDNYGMLNDRRINKEDIQEFELMWKTKVFTADSCK